MSDSGSLRVTAVAISSQLGGTERVLLDFASRAFEFGIALRVITPKPGPLIDLLNDSGVPADVVPAPASLLRGSQRGAGLLTAPLALMGLRLWSARLTTHSALRDADVIYSVSFKTHLATARRRDPDARGPAIVWHLHEFPPVATGIAWKALARRIPDAMIANSRAVARAWADRADKAGTFRPFALSPVVTIPNGIDLDRFRPGPRAYWIHERLGIPRADRIMGMPAVLARWKGQLETIDAFARIADAFPEVHLVFVGGNIYDTSAERTFERDLVAQIARRRMAGLKRIHLLPFQPDIETVYPELDVAVHYSTRPEAFGRVVLEAMACGVPVIAAAEGGPREIVTEGGWLVPPRKPKALAAAMTDALRLSAAAREQVGRQGRTRAEDCYSARKFAKEVAEVLWRVRSEE